MADEYNWPIDKLVANGTVKLHRDRTAVFDFPSTTMADASGVTASFNAGNHGATNFHEGFLERHSLRVADVVITAIMVVILVAAAGGFLLLQSKDRAQSAFDSCQQSVSIYQSSTERLKKTASDAQPVAQISTDAVTDPKTIDTLNAAINDAKAAGSMDASCTAGRADAQNAAVDAQYTKATRDLGVKNEAVLAASAAVTASKSAKDAQNARETLREQLQQAQALSNTKAGSQADPTARKQLSEALTQAQTLLASDQLMDASTYQNAGKALQNGADAVNKSALG